MLLTTIQHPPVITIIGTGAYGTAIAIALAKNGHPVLLSGQNSTHIQTLKKNRCNLRYLPNIPFPSNLQIEDSLPIALNYCQDILIAVPSQIFNHTLMQLKSNIVKKNVRIIIGSKGLEPDTGKLLQNVTQTILGKQTPIAIISGPTFAQELAIGLPTAITLASNNISLAHDIKKLLDNNKNLKVYNETDMIGIQIAGAVKNIIAIGAGISDGIGFGANARTALITKGLKEMSQLGITLGATTKIFIGLAGLGDLILTCTDNQSRNRRFGILIGQGETLSNAQKKIGKIIEGIQNTKSVHILSKKYKVNMPITEQVYQILYHKKNVHSAAQDLLKCIKKT